MTDQCLLQLHSRLKPGALEAFKLRKAKNLSTDAVHAFFTSFENEPVCERLNIDECLKISSETIVALSLRFPNLINLSLQWCTHFIDSAAIYEVIMNCVHLRELSLSGCKQMTSDFITNILDGIQKYRVSNTDE